MPLFTICVFICIQTSNVDGFDAKESSPVNMVKIKLVDNKNISL